MPNTRRVLRCLIIFLVIVFPHASGCSGNRDDRPAGKEQNPTTQSSVPLFSGENAFNHLLRIVSFGPRNPNSRGHADCLAFLTTRLQQLADTIRIQRFTQRGYDGTISLSNLVVSFNPGEKDRILICTHWDTRPRAERDADHTRWDEPMLGANDGGSGTAVLLELAGTLHGRPPTIGVDLVFFDGEDYGFEGDTENYLLGSRYFARTKPPDYSPRFGILLDMIGDAQLEIHKESNSLQLAPDVVDLVWQKAAMLGFLQFVDTPGLAVIDDHLPLNEVGIRTIDLIDFSYPDESNRYWHTHEDTPDKCSPESLGVIGTLLTHIIYTQSPLR